MEKKLTLEKVIHAIECTGNVTEAAKLLGVRRPYLYQFLRRAGYEVVKTIKVVPKQKE